MRFIAIVFVCFGVVGCDDNHVAVDAGATDARLVAHLDDAPHTTFDRDATLVFCDGTCPDAP